MNNSLAASLLNAANKYYSWKEKAFAGNLEMLKIGTSDYEDLVSIANMIENGTDTKIISKAIMNLDTIVRDIIPTNVYNAYIR